LTLQTPVVARDTPDAPCFWQIRFRPEGCHVPSPGRRIDGGVFRQRRCITGQIGKLIGEGSV
jgi:hypothetical protein